MIIELLILAGLFLVFIGVVMLAIIHWLEAREERKTIDRDWETSLPKLIIL